jgi:hypothetical protein
MNAMEDREVLALTAVEPRVVLSQRHIRAYQRRKDAVPISEHVEERCGRNHTQQHERERSARAASP